MTEPSKAIVQRPVGGPPEGQGSPTKHECPVCWAKWDVVRWLGDAMSVMILIENVVICKNGHAFWINIREGFKDDFSLVTDPKTGEPIPVDYGDGS